MKNLYFRRESINLDLKRVSINLFAIFFLDLDWKPIDLLILNFNIHI
ncbi:hypothetical protein BCL90_3307 [Pedobacter alluvionis]|uniref:Uncharacterized protein n=1 Tax=Pedobacter alluvionis TaxID=475253 RepID=A0A497XXX8_9SPHI|nr:hypothetical protein BCL90_3307 [Pedobacter alluvionis]